MSTANTPYTLSTLATLAANVGTRESGRTRRLRLAGRQPNGRPLLRGAAGRRSDAAFRRRLLRQQDRG